MKVDMEAKDRFGRLCYKFDTTDINKIYEWLWKNYGGEGYKFVVVIDVALDYEFTPQKCTCVYFMDCIQEEYEDYMK